MARKRDAEAIYEVAALFRERCLKSGDSLLWPRHHAWTAANTKRLWDAVFGHPDTSKSGFFAKLEIQLTEEPEDVHCIAADLLAVYYLFPGDIGKEKKLENLQSVISWKLSNQQTDLGMIERAYDTSIGSVGTAYQSAMPSQIQFLLEFAQGVEAGKADSESSASCASLADEISSRVSFAQAGRNVLLHLLFPETFERIASRAHKKAIVAAFSNLTAAGEDDDQALATIRTKLATEHGGSEFDFYLPEVQKLWDVGSSALPKKRKNVAVAAEKVGSRLDAGSQDRGSVTKHWLLTANPRIWNFNDDPVGARQTYTSHNEKGNKRQRYDCFLAVRPGDLVVGYVASPDRQVVAICRITKSLYQTSEGDEEIEFEKIEQIDSPIPLETLQTNPVLSRSEPVIQNFQGSLFRLTPEEFNEVRDLIESPQPEKAQTTSYSKQDAMKSVFISEKQFDQIMASLREKKNVILQGPPGVGKTFIARRLAFGLIGEQDQSRVQMIQFHQSYSYEDFIQGFRPSSEGKFVLKNGLFYQFCRNAQRDSTNKPYVFIIDEINRGNLSKIFGELMMLLESDKRGREFALPLAYSDSAIDDFFVPENVFLIGTMNTADRSLSMVDYALRRRFRFITLEPEFQNPSFGHYLGECGADESLVHKIVDRVTRLNSLIAADDKNLGRGYQIGHSYFCPRHGVTPDAEWYARVIEFEVKPLLEEYWLDQKDRVESQVSSLLD
jgi:predicted RNA-binding protein with PUA-like domain